DVLRAIRRRNLFRRDADDREVRSAAADIGDQNDLLARNGGLVFQGRGDRLELELDMLEPDLSRRLLQIALRLAIELGRVFDELNRPAEHDLTDLMADLALGRGFEVAQIEAEDIGERDVALLDPCPLMKQRPTDHAFQRAHEAAILARQVISDRRAAKG